LLFSLFHKLLLQWDLTAERCYQTTAVVLTSPNHTLSHLSDRKYDDIACCSGYSLTLRGQWNLTAERCYQTAAVVFTSQAQPYTQLYFVTDRMTTLLAVLAIPYPLRGQWDLTAERCYQTTAVVLTSPNYTFSHITVVTNRMTTLLAVLAIPYPLRGQWDQTAERFYQTTAVVLTSPNHSLSRICNRQDDDIACCFCYSLTCVGSGI
jgi:hypothetical protein